MKWNIDSSGPIYLQLMEQLQFGIISGVYQPGQQLPPVRELATEAGVNPNTMQRAFSELETVGLVYTKRTLGRFITEDTAQIEQLRKEYALNELEKFVERMYQLGYNREEILSMTQETMSEQ